MPVTITPIEQDHALLFTFHDPWRLTDLTSHYPAATAHMDHARFKIHVVIDLRASKVLVPNGILQARNGINFYHANLGTIIIVGANELSKRIAETVFRIGKYDKIQFVSDIDQAFVAIQTLISHAPDMAP